MLIYLWLWCFPSASLFFYFICSLLPLPSPPACCCSSGGSAPARSVGVCELWLCVCELWLWVCAVIECVRHDCGCVCCVCVFDVCVCSVCACDSSLDQHVMVQGDSSTTMLECLSLLSTILFLLQFPSPFILCVSVCERECVCVCVCETERG